MEGPSPGGTAARQDTPEGPPEVHVAQRVAQWVDGGVDVAHPVTWRRGMARVGGGSTEYSVSELLAD